MFTVIKPAFVVHQHFPSFVADPNYLMANERMNLMNMAKLSIKGLIESALNLGRTLDSDYAPLQQFFVVMEHCLKHGLKGNSEAGHEPSALQGTACSGEQQCGVKTELCSLHETEERLSSHCCDRSGLGRPKEGTKTCRRGKVEALQVLAVFKTAFQLSWV